jgi:hypothetical protein
MLRPALQDDLLDAVPVAVQPPGDMRVERAPFRKLADSLLESLPAFGLPSPALFRRLELLERLSPFGEHLQCLALQVLVQQAFRRRIRHVVSFFIDCASWFDAERSRHCRWVGGLPMILPYVGTVRNPIRLTLSRRQGRRADDLTLQYGRLAVLAFG